MQTHVSCLRPPLKSNGRKIHHELMKRFSSPKRENNSWSSCDVSCYSNPIDCVNDRENIMVVMDVWENVNCAVHNVQMFWISFWMKFSNHSNDFVGFGWHIHRSTQNCKRQKAYELNLLHSYMNNISSCGPYRKHHNTVIYRNWTNERMEE